MAARSPAERPLSKNFFGFYCLSLQISLSWVMRPLNRPTPPTLPLPPFPLRSAQVIMLFIEYRTCQAPQGIPNQELEALSQFQFQSHFKFERFPLSLIHCEANWQQTKTPHGFHIQHHLYREGADCNGINLSAYCPHRLWMEQWHCDCGGYARPLR